MKYLNTCVIHRPGVNYYDRLPKTFCCAFIGLGGRIVENMCLSAFFTKVENTNTSVNARERVHFKRSMYLSALPKVENGVGCVIYSRNCKKQLKRGEKNVGLKLHGAIICVTQLSRRTIPVANAIDKFYEPLSCVGWCSICDAKNLH